MCLDLLTSIEMWAMLESFITWNHIYVNESKHICVFRFINIYKNIGDAKKFYNKTEVVHILAAVCIPYLTEVSRRMGFVVQFMYGAYLELHLVL